MIINYLVCFLFGIVFGVFIIYLFFVSSDYFLVRQLKPKYQIKKMNKAIHTPYVYLYEQRTGIMYNVYGQHIYYDFKLKCFQIDSKQFFCKDYLTKWYFVKI